MFLVIYAVNVNSWAYSRALSRDYSEVSQTMQSQITPL